MKNNRNEYPFGCIIELDINMIHSYLNKNDLKRTKYCDT